ncbi:MAG TPA: CDP-alcohol phosphatidyltransferase family protein [Solirubrobacterales bacterium]
MAETRLELTRRRLFGIDRTGPDPRETRSGEPLRPFTIPNMVGYARLAGLPVFLYLAFESGDGRSFWSAAVFWLIAVGDFVDGFLARATGQYSRMGALLDPIIDRLTVLSGCAVCWHFDLLPKWGLAIVVAREVVTLAIAQAGLNRGIDIEINWLGRIGVFFVMGGIFFALAVSGWVPEALFVFGLVAAIAASFFYVRAGFARLRETSPRKA